MRSINAAYVVLSVAIAILIPDAIAYLALAQFLPDLLASNLAGIIGCGIAPILIMTVNIILEGGN